MCFFLQGSWRPNGESQSSASPDFSNQRPRFKTWLFTDNFLGAQSPICLIWMLEIMSGAQVFAVLYFNVLPFEKLKEGSRVTRYVVPMSL